MPRRSSSAARGNLAGLVGFAVGAVVIGLALPAVVDGRAPATRTVTRPEPLPADHVGVGAASPTVPSARTPGSVPASRRRDEPRRSPTSASSSGSERRPSSGEQGTTSGRGLTASTISIGVLLADIGGLARAGVDVPVGSPEDQRRGYQVAMDDLNRRGGIHGRRVTAVFRTYDPFNEDTMRAACLSLTQDQKVFAVLEAVTFFGPSILCITDENRTPFLLAGGAGIPAGYHRRSDGRLFTLAADGVRMLSMFVHELERLGRFRDLRIGVIGDDYTDPGGATIEAGIVAPLRALGHRVTHRSRFSRDLATAAGQVPIEVQQMRAAGVDVVLLVARGLLNSQFVNTADGQGWRPGYHLSDWSGAMADTNARNMPPSFHGTLGITTSRVGEWRVDLPEPPAEAACRRLWEAATGERTDRSQSTYFNATGPCGLLRLFEAGAAHAGRDLTIDRFSTGMQTLGRVQLVGYGGGSFREGKFDAADLIRSTRFDRDCTCFLPVDGFRMP